VVNLTSRLPEIRKRNPVPIEYEAGWAPEPVWTFWKTDESLTTEIRTLDSPARSPVTIPTALYRLAHTLTVLFPSYEYRFRFTALQIYAPLFVS